MKWKIITVLMIALKEKEVEAIEARLQKLYSGAGESIRTKNNIRNIELILRKAKKRSYAGKI